MSRFKELCDRLVREGKAKVVWTPETGWTDQEKRDLAALDDQIKALAGKVWAEHPNNPDNKGE